jgi:hypothetical protein
VALEHEERDPIAERVALNDATFRAANESIADAADSIGVEGLLPFICECADTRCTNLLRLTRAEYEAVRADPTRFINAAGHERSAQGWARVAESHERYTVVEKVGDAADVVVETDPRGPEPVADATDL